jgi:lipid-binding SYLF domain-containing protein
MRAAANVRAAMKRSALILLAALGLSATACYRDSAPPGAPAASKEQQIIDRSAAAVERMRASGKFPSLEYFLTNARGVMIFPRVIKASLIFGGEGGSGVLLSRDKKGAWSAPAFYSLGAGSAGFQLGYQEATVLLFFMNESALMSAIGRGLTLGADASVAAGTMGDSGKAASTSTGSDIYQLVDVGGVFAGVSLDGTVVSARETFNREYYGPTASTYGIVVERKLDAGGTAALKAALAPR